MPQFLTDLPRIPVTILAGFLGAGKTTLLNRILHAEHGLRVAVLINDFGEVNIDAKLVDGDQASDMISLPNGCICCTLFSSLVTVLAKLTQLEEPPEHILIEASGVSQPHQIVDILHVSDLQERLRLDSVITLVDAENVQRLAQVVMFIEQQLSDADLILLNKIDLIPPESIDDLILWIQDIAPNARILTTSYADVPLELLLGAVPVERASPLTRQNHVGESHEHEHDHGLEFETWTYNSDTPLDEESILQALEHLPSTIYRGKGFVHLANAPDLRMVVQMVGKRVQLYADGAWDEETPRTQLVFIGAPGAIEGVVLDSL